MSDAAREGEMRLPIDDDFDMSSIGEGNGLDLLLESHFRTEPDLPEQLTGLRSRWTSAEITAARQHFLESINFRPRGEPLMPRHDNIPFYKRVAEGVEEYRAKHRRSAEKSGSEEAAEYGLATIGEQDVVVYSMDFSFMGGSLATVAGKRYLEALELAQQRDVPLVSLFSSGGARQDENTLALYQMERTVGAMNHARREKPNIVTVSVVLGELWGGMTASAFPQADYRVALTGSRMGFAGTRVIEAQEQRRIDDNAQRVEVHALWRHVDYLVDDVDELRGHLNRVFSAMEHPKNDFDPEKVQRMQPIRTERATRTFEFTERVVDDPHRPPAPGTAAMYFTAELREELDYDTELEKLLASGNVKEADAALLARGLVLDRRYKNLLMDAARPDTSMLMELAFTNTVAFYNRFYDIEKQMFIYPDIVAGIGKIGNQPFMIIGDQPSYVANRRDASVMKRNATPRPVDMQYMKRMLDLGKRLDLPLVLLTDTPGAEASLQAEQEGQFSLIAEILDKYPSYPRPIISVIHGMQGSGGGLITSPVGDRLMMSERGIMSVAEPGSAAVIIYGAHAGDQERRDTIVALAPDAESQFLNGLIDEIIIEEGNPYENAARIQDAIIRAYDELRKHSKKDLLKRRMGRLLSAEVFEPVKE